MAIVVALVLGLHLICMNVASAAPLYAIWFDVRQKPRAPGNGVARWLAAASVALFIFGMVLGVGVGALIWEKQFAVALGRLNSRVFFGVWELVFSLVLLAVYAIWLAYQPQPGVWVRAVRSILPVLSSSNLLYHFPFLFYVIRTVMAEDSVEAVSSSEFRSRIMEGEALARAAHFLLASFAVSGAAVMLYVLRNRDEESKEHLLATGAWLTLVPTLLQVPVGIWVLLQLDDQVQALLLGGHLPATSLFGFSVLAAMFLLHQLANVAMGESKERGAWISLGALVVIILAMSGVLQFVA